MMTATQRATRIPQMSELQRGLVVNRFRNMRAKKAAEMTLAEIEQFINTHPVRGGSGGSSALTPQQLADLNAAQRSVILGSAVQMTQALPSQNIPGTVTNNNNVLTFNLRNVGLVKRVLLEISGTYNNTDGALAATPTAFGLANLLSNCTLFDLNNQQRINTNGIHLALLKQVKHRSTDPGSAPVGTAQSDAMVAGEFVAAAAAPNFPVIVYPLPAFGVSGAFRAVFEVPIAYSDEDLRGCMYLNVINAVAQLQLTLNFNPSPKAADNTFAVWGAASGTISNVTVTPYQVYLDQLPSGQGGVVLPILDASTIYELKNTNLSGQIQANQDFPISYSNFRDFLSTLILFNSTAATAGLKNGSDVSYWALQSANFTNLWKIDPLLAAQFTREIIGSDLPLGTYYFSHRKKPISTLQYGNMQLILNALSASAGAYVNIMWEDFAMVNALSQAGSLA